MSSSSPKSSHSHQAFTIPTLLSSLHQHLQEQTELLPTLHAQLGLPKSALSDELSSLHQRLTTCVEEQIELRREEVDNWMKKCDIIERECSRYTKTLGGHTKVLSTSLGELKKQKALPVRHEMLNQHLEKLDHLYKAKLEQLSNLTNRIVMLSRTLGPDFFSIDTAEPPPAYGESGAEEKTLRDVSPEKFSKLEKECARARSEITRRLQQLSATFMQMDWLYQELAIEPPTEEIDPFSPSTSKRDMLKAKRSSTLDDDPFAASTSTPTPCPRSKRKTVSLLINESETLSEYRSIYSNFIVRMDELEAEGKDVEDGNALAGVEGVDPTVGLMTWAEETKASLEEVKIRRETQIQSMYDQLEALWKRLGVEDSDIDEFVERNRGSTEETVNAYETELERMMELKSQSMSVFVGNARIEIEGLWDELMFGEDERAEFSPFTDDEFTEDLLTAHEEEIARLKEERKSKAPILVSLRKYFEICDGEKELAAAAQDQSRLLGRGPRDPGRLLREEKMRKRVQREKPKLEQELMTSIPAWEEEEGRPFLVNGESMIEVLESMGASAKNGGRAAKPRAGSVPPRAGAGPSNANGRPGHNRSTSSESATGSVHGPGANKRARVVSSTSGRSKARATSSTSSNSTDHEERTIMLPHRAPFGSRSGALNASDSSAMHSSGLMTTQKKRGMGTARTPSTSAIPSSASSTIPRPASAASRTRPTPSSSHSTLKKPTHGLGLGIGHATSSAQRGRAVSASAAVANKTRMGSVGRSGGRATTTNLTNAKATAKNAKPVVVPMRNSRRESFRPRPSMADAGLPRYVPGYASSVDEDY